MQPVQPYSFLSPHVVGRTQKRHHSWQFQKNRATIVSAYRSQVFDLRASTAALRLFSGKPLNSFALLF